MFKKTNEAVKVNSGKVGNIRYYVKAGNTYSRSASSDVSNMELCRPYRTWMGDDILMIGLIHFMAFPPSHLSNWSKLHCIRFVVGFTLSYV